MTFSGTDRGVLIAADNDAKWLLPWWWGHFSRYNDLPVAVVDLGLSEEKKAWCRDKALLIELKTSPVAAKESLPASVVRRWENSYSRSPKVWEARNAWFQKPRAFACTPFALTLWLDLDCEVMGCVDAIFTAFDRNCEMALAREQRNSASRWALYNSGVVLFKKGAPLIKEWEEACCKNSGKFMGDQDVLSYLIRKNPGRVQELPLDFNWQIYGGFNPAALIHHWVGTWGKEYIQKFGGIHALFQS